MQREIGIRVAVAANPVNHGLVKHPKDWPWSSWSFYFPEESGLVPIDVVDL